MLSTGCVSFQDPGWRVDSPQGCGQGAKLTDLMKAEGLDPELSVLRP